MKSNMPQNKQNVFNAFSSGGTNKSSAVSYVQKCTYPVLG